jgi:hypothetical protein
MQDCQTGKASEALHITSSSFHPIIVSDPLDLRA